MTGKGAAVPRSRKGKSDLFKATALLPRCCFCFGARRSRSGSFAVLLFAAGWNGTVFSGSFQRAAGPAVFCAGRGCAASPARRASVSFAVGAHPTANHGHSGFCRGKGGLRLFALPERAAPRRDQGIGLPAECGNASGNDGASAVFRPIGRADGPGFAGHDPVGSGGRPAAGGSSLFRASLLSGPYLPRGRPIFCRRSGFGWRELFYSA